MDKPDEAFCQRVARHCLGKRVDHPTPEHPKHFGFAFTKWDGAHSLLDRFGKPQPLAILDDGQVIPTTLEHKFQRIAATLNEIKSYGHAAPLRLDMQDARDYGLAQSPVEWPVITYNRHENATNLVLWPLVGYHTPGARHFVHHAPIDTLLFDQKSDIARWRGALAGRPNKALRPHAGPRRFAATMLAEISAETSEAQLKDLHEELMGVTRYNVAVKYVKSNTVDAFLTLRDDQKTAQNSALLAPLCKPREPLEWFFESKYILSLSGTDTGSNFLMAANSNSVTLKEEDGWALFYTGEFKPWVHYIPLKRGATDLDEKLEWAKANPRLCKEMSKAAQAVCAQFAAPQNRERTLSLVLEGLDGG
ncbi:MAG: hypothetical protein GQ535_01655 [Rhodobacteraceae bacterium]|nr:hypothetical protein [Paracoccaceae bacterium]